MRRGTGFVRYAVHAGVVAFVTMAPNAHAAAPRGARLVWARGEGAESCVGARGLEEDVKGRLGFDPFAGQKVVEIEIEGTAVRTSTGFRAELTFRDAGGAMLGTRHFESRDPTCRTLGEAVAVAVTVAIDPDAPDTRPPSPEPTPDEPPPPAVIRVPKPPREMARASLSVGVGGGLVPSTSLVTSLRGHAFVGRHVEIGLGVRVWPESRSNGVGFGLVGGELSACVTPWSIRGPLRLCGGGIGGMFQVFVHDPSLAPVEVGSFSWFGLEVGPAVSLRVVGPVRLDAGISAFVPLTRRQAFLRDRESPLWEQSVVGGVAELGIGAFF